MKIFISGLGLCSLPGISSSKSEKPGPNVKHNFMLNELEPSALVIKIEPLIEAQTSSKREARSDAEMDSQASNG